MKFTMRCEICGETKDDHFVRFSKKKGAFGGCHCCLSCLKRLLNESKTEAIFQKTRMAKLHLDNAFVMSIIQRINNGYRLHDIAIVNPINPCISQSPKCIVLAFQTIQQTLIVYLSLDFLTSSRSSMKISYKSLWSGALCFMRRPLEYCVCESRKTPSKYRKKDVQRNYELE